MSLGSHIWLLAVSNNIFNWRFFLSTKTETYNYSVQTEATQRDVMGPVDYLTVRFQGNKFSGKIVPELVNLERNGVIRIIDLAFVFKDENGSQTITEAKDLKGAEGTAYAEFANHTAEWFTEDDIKAIADTLPNNSSAALFLYENVWAKKFKAALLNADAEIIDMGRIPPESIAKVEAQLKAKGGNY